MTEQPEQPEQPDQPGPDAADAADGSLAERIAEDIAALTELTEAGMEIDGEVQVTESTWAVYGHGGYDGEVIVGEYHDEIEATAVFRAAPRPAADDEDHGTPPGPPDQTP